MPPWNKEIWLLGMQSFSLAKIEDIRSTSTRKAYDKVVSNGKAHYSAALTVVDIEMVSCRRILEACMVRRVGVMDAEVLQMDLSRYKGCVFA